MKGKKIVGGLMIIGGIVLGLYVGVWVCFIGGVVGVIMEIKAEHLSAMGVAVGATKVMFAGLAGWLSFAVLFIPGKFMLDT